MSTKHTDEESKQKLLNKIIARRKNTHKDDETAPRPEHSSNARNDSLTK